MECKVATCRKTKLTDSKFNLGKGLCNAHVIKLRRYGNAATPNRIERHGMEDTLEYRAWSGMKTRCYNTREPAYQYYGGRGIRVCDRWLHSFSNFFSDMGYKPEGYSLDRIDTDGDYEPSNCRWVPWNVQQQNKRTPSANQTGYRGIFRTKKTGNYSVTIGVGSKRVRVGTYSTLEEALSARLHAEDIYW